MDRAIAICLFLGAPNYLITGAVVGAGSIILLGVISLTKCTDAIISSNPISFFIDICDHHNKNKIDDLRVNPAGLLNKDNNIPFVKKPLVR